MTPRRASEQLVSAALDHVGSSEALVVDVGTGVGAIAVAIATAAPNVRVFATDTSPRAVVLARENVRRHSLSDRVTVYPRRPPRPGARIDRPRGRKSAYLPAADAGCYPDLAKEPPDAVFASGDGLEPYRRLLSACGERLDDEAAVIIQLHRRVLAATGAELPALRGRLEPTGRALEYLALRAAA